MSDYMKEAERLLDEFYLHVSATVASALADEWAEVQAAQTRSVHTRAALLAHIQRGAPAPAEVPMPKPVAYGFGNTAITGHTNRLMMVRIDIPGGDQYAGAFWLPLVLADEAHTYGVACRAAGEAAGYARAANWLRAKAEKHAEENGYHEPDTGAFVFAGRAAEEWNNSVLELADEMEAALRGEVKP